MRIRLKELSQQVIVLTGATSGIGLVTARMAASRGARLVLVARNEDALKQLTAELTGKGGEVAYVVADVGDQAQVQRAAEVAQERFGGFDTWVNNAGVSIFGRMEDVPLTDQRRLFDTNFWGVVHGSLVAAQHLKQRGGAIVNLGSEVSEVAMPLQGVYSASKHAVKGYTDALRIELEQACAPVSVTLIRPAAIDTMFVEHAKNYMDVEPRLPPPVYAPETAARAILHAAAHPTRDIYVGAAARMGVSGARIAPRIADFMLRTFVYRAQRGRRLQGEPNEGALYGPGRGMRERQGLPSVVLERSLYTQAVTHPKTTAALGLALLMGVLWWLFARPREITR
jgi:short-subunit dehydrogenase